MTDLVDFSLVSTHNKLRRQVIDPFCSAECATVGGVVVHEWRGLVKAGRKVLLVRAFSPFGVRPRHWLAVGGSSRGAASPALPM